MREVHLATHLEQAKILTAEQITRYMQLRGYAAAGPKSDHEHHHH